MGPAFIKSSSGLFALLAAGIVTTASAADLPSRVLAAVPPAVTTPAWGGLYLGVNGGYGGGGNFVYPYTVTAGAISQSTINASLTAGGLVGGGQIGYNYAVPQFGLPYGAGVVLGAEADYDAASIAGNVQLIGVSPGGGSAAGGFVGSRITSLGTARGRIGLSFGRFLVFGSGGFAFGETHDNSVTTLGKSVFISSSSAMHSGKAFGGGVEFLVTDNVTFRCDFLRAGLNTKFVGAGATITRSLALAEQPQTNVVRGAINYKIDFFNPVSVPVVARY